MAQKYEVRIQFTAEDDAAAKERAKKAATAAGGKVDKVMTEKLAFRSLGDD